MLKTLIQLLNNLSRYFNLNIFQFICRQVRHIDRRNMAWHLLQQEAEQVTFRRNDILWTGNTWDATIMISLFSKGHFQGQEIQALIAWMKQHKRLGNHKNVIVDVGANIGTSSIPFALQTSCRILAIEPVLELFNFLQQNVSQNGLVERITCIQKAVFRSPGYIEMVLPESGCGGAVINPPDLNRNLENCLKSKIRERMKVPTDTLMNILTSCQIVPEQVAFVWSDTEGSEVEVIETGQSLWLNGVPLYLELFPDALQIQNQLQSITSLITNYFDRYLNSADLVSAGVNAPIRQISELSILMDALYKQNTNANANADVLLLPKRFEFNPIPGSH